MSIVVDHIFGRDAIFQSFFAVLSYMQLGWGFHTQPNKGNNRFGRGSPNTHGSKLTRMRFRITRKGLFKHSFSNFKVKNVQSQILTPNYRGPLFQIRKTVSCCKLKI